MNSNQPLKILASIATALMLVASSLSPALAALQVQGTVTVQIVNFAFEPAEIRITPGTTVTWIQQDSAPHTATSTAQLWSSGTLNQGDRFSFTFSSEGTFPYICSFHPFMQGQVIVAAPTPTPTVAPMPSATFMPMSTMTPPPGMTPAMGPMVAQQLASVGSSLLLVISFYAADTTDPWKLYDPSAPSFANDLTQLEAGRGYWVKVSQAGSISYGGNTYPLIAGYNLVGWRG